MSGEDGAAPRSPSRVSRRSPLAGTAVVAAVLLLVVVAATMMGPWIWRPRIVGISGGAGTAPATEETGTITLPPTQATSPPEPPLDLPLPDLRWLGYVAAGFVVAALVGLLLRYLAYRRRPFEPDPAEQDRLIAIGEVEQVPELPVLQRGVQAAQRHLAQIREPGDAIIAAWLALEDAAAGSGVRRRPAETPTEFTVDVLGRTTADPVATDRLLHLYHRARFSTSPVRPEDAAAASECLADLARSWSGVAPPAAEKEQEPS